MAYTPTNVGTNPNTVNLRDIAMQNPGMTISSTGQVLGAAGPSPMTIDGLRAQQQQIAATRNQFHADHPGATTMTTGQLYGVGAPNNYGGPYVAPSSLHSPNWYSSQQGWGNDQGGNAAAQWDEWARNRQGQYGTGAGGSLGGTANGGGVQGNGASYGAGYTGFGGSSLTASGGPVYNGGGANGGPGGGGGGNGSSTPGVPDYYAGARTPIANYVPRQQYGVAPFMPTLNTNLAPPTTGTTTRTPVAAGGTTNPYQTTTTRRQV